MVDRQTVNKPGAKCTRGRKSLAQMPLPDQRGLKSLRAMQQDRNNWAACPGSGGCSPPVGPRHGPNEWEVYEMKEALRKLLLPAVAAAGLMVGAFSAQAETVLHRGNGAEPETLDPAKST